VKLSRLELDGRAGEDLVEYADGWTIVDASNGGRVADEVLGVLYEALESRRVSQASLGLLDGRELAVCGQCGERGTLVVRLLPPVVFASPADSANTYASLERGPPRAMLLSVDARRSLLGARLEAVTRPGDGVCCSRRAS
jgi:hypothetical protein